MLYNQTVVLLGLFIYSWSGVRVSKVYYGMFRYDFLLASLFGGE